jgi:hypothetical protein
MIRNRTAVLRIVLLTAFMLGACVLQSAYDQLQRKIGSCKRGSCSRGRAEIHRGGRHSVPGRQLPVQPWAMWSNSPFGPA